MTKTLLQILSALPPAAIIEARGELERPITAPVVEAVADLEEGGVFVARRGAQFDGHEFIDEAIDRGAAAIVGERPSPKLSLPYAQLHDAQQQVGILSAAYFDWPACRLTLIGVSGTDGKTTTTHLLSHILQQRFPGRVGLVSTLLAYCGDEKQATGLHVTSPPAPQMQAYLARMVAHGLTHAVLEMTSHGLAQGRVQGVRLASAVLTNIQHEHLDFHGGWEEYRAAKGRMFEYLRGAPATRVINADDDASQIFVEAPCTTFGYGEAADFRVEDIREASDGFNYRLRTTSGSVDIHSLLSGVYNAANGAAAAAAAAPFIAGDLGTIQQGIAVLRYLPGRMEPIDEGQRFHAIVDFAHTPAALRKALESTRRMLTGGQRLCVVFGSAGLRDVAKRRLMAEIATELADYVVLTAEDPRTESLDDILAVMAAACREHGGQEGCDFTRIRDRGAALQHACEWACTGDIVLACGKGHEQSMCFGTTEYHWDDREALRAAIRGNPLCNLPTAQQ